MGLFDLFKATPAKRYRIPHGMSAKDYAQSLLYDVEFHCEEINTSTTVFDFSYSYGKLSKTVDELIWLHEKKRISMFPSPRSEWQRIQDGLGKSIECFIERYMKYAPTHGAARIEAIEDFCDEIEKDEVFSKILRTENKNTIRQLREEATTIREKVAEEERIQQRNSVLNSIGLRWDVDASDLDPFVVADRLEQILKNLYQYCLVNGLSFADTQKVYIDFKSKCASYKLPLASEIRLEALLAEYDVKFSESNPIHAVDAMDGQSFELWCAALLQKLGYSKVQTTKASGDDGVDLLAEKEGIRYAIQCKCYSSNLGKSPIQEVNAGKAMPMYHCQIGVVMTNRHFTKGARELAEANGVLLWDRDWIINATQKTQ